MNRKHAHESGKNVRKPNAVQSLIPPQDAMIFEDAVQRASEAIRFFEEKGAASDFVLNRAFFMYMSVKKDAQRLIIEKIALSQGIVQPQAYLRGESGAFRAAETSESEENFQNIFSAVHEIAAEELDFYLNFAAKEKDVRLNAILLMLADLSKEFLFDIKIWYLNHKDAAQMDEGVLCGPEIGRFHPVSILD